MSRIFVIHENEEWLPPLAEALDHYGLEWSELYMSGRPVDLSDVPEDGVYYNRMSASSWTREHGAAPQLTLALLENLQTHGRRVVNKARALDLEVSKARQVAVLERAGIRTPRSVLAAGAQDIARAARTFEGPVILKPDCGGKGAGVELFETGAALAERAEAGGLDVSPTSLSADAISTRSRSTPAAGSSCARRMCARSAMRRVRWARARMSRTSSRC